MTSCTTEMAFFHSNFMLQQQTPPPPPHINQEAGHDNDQSHPSTTSLPQHQFHGVASLLGKRSSVSFCEEMSNNNNNNEMNNHQHPNGEEELSDDEGSQIGEKKRRLNLEQVKTLEKNFELGNKLEPERKMQLARALGLQPRQVAIWFQNRRARWKTKQLEKDYDLLKKQFEAVKAENDALQAQNHKLHAEIMALKTREPTESINLNKETEGSCSNRSENSSEIKLAISRAPAAAIDSPLSTHPNGPGLFQPLVNRPNVVAQLFQNPSRPELNGPKLDQSVKEEGGLCNMFCGMDDQAGFWPWLDQPNFN